MSLACMQCRGLMDRRASGLNDADRLRLEAHLSTCRDCVAHGQVLSQLVSLARDQHDQLSEMSRQRVITSALAHAAKTQHEQGAVGYTLWPRVAVIGGGLLTIAVVVALMRGAASPQGSDPRVAHYDRPPATPAAQSYGAAQARNVTIDGATLRLEAGTDVTWDAQRARVTLLRGGLRAVVASRAGKIPFSVRTPKLTVVVIGTDFEVTVDTVRVHEGVVRVEDNSGVVLHAGLRAGETWPLETVVNDVVVNGPVSDAQSAPAQRAVEGSRPAERSATHWLSDARQRLSAGDLSGARQAIAQLRRSHVELSQRAEAETLLAEAFQVEGKTARALAQYDAVARDYPKLGAGDNAMFAAARLALMSGDHAGAATRFESYLRAYPRGRFHQEAARALAKREVGHVGASDR